MYDVTTAITASVGAYNVPCCNATLSAGLVVNTQYNFQVVAANRIGNSTYSFSPAAKLGNTPPDAVTITSLVTTTTQPNVVTVLWDALSQSQQGSGPIFAYRASAYSVNTSANSTYSRSVTLSSTVSPLTATFDSLLSNIR